jgi:hypothetical protein
VNNVPQEPKGPILSNLTIRIIVGCAAIFFLSWYFNSQETKRMTFQQTPEGHQQTTSELEIQKIKACAEAAGKGVLGPGCTAMPPESQKPHVTQQLIIPSPFSQQ